MAKRKPGDMLTHSEARGIAETLWGTGGTHATRTNTRGAFWFNCAGHGGLIVDARALDPTQRRAIDALGCFVEPFQARRYFNGTRCRFWHPYIWNTRRYRYTHCETIDVYVFEEDCDWALAVEYAGIWPLKMDPERFQAMRQEAAREIARREAQAREDRARQAQEAQEGGKVYEPS